MTETDRLRWEPGEDGILFGYSGTLKPWVFAICPPSAPGDFWMISTSFPLGQPRYVGSEKEARNAAGRWLEEFVSSLGAIFPGGHPEGNAIEAYCATETEDGDDRHLLQYAVRLPGGTTTAYGDQSWVSAGLAARDNDGASTVVRDIWLSYGPWRTHETSAPERS